MKKGIPNDITNNDGKIIVNVKTFADLEVLKEYKQKGTDVRIVMHPNDCIDPYPQLVQRMTEILGIPNQIGLGGFSKEVKN